MTRTRPHPDARATVQLLHTLPDGSAHIDWLIARDPEGRGLLRSFQSAGRVDEIPVAGQCQLVRTADHRPIYLSYQGPVQGAGGAMPSVDRGTVRRVAEGWICGDGADRVDQRLELQWSGPDGRDRMQTYHLVRGAPPNWTLHRLS